MVMMLVDPSYYLESATRGLTLFATTVLPSLFPFFFCATLLTKIGGASVISNVLKKPVKLLFNSPPEGAYVMTLSMLSGYPVGAGMISELYRGGAITTDEAKTICAYASTSGPVFMLGTLGSAIFHNPAVGIIALSAHYLAAILNGVIFRTRKNAKRSEAHPADILGSDNALSESITRATASMLAVGGFIVIAGMLVDTLAKFDLLLLLSNNLPPDAAQTLTALLYGLIEMTRGSLECAKIPDLQLATALAAALISFGGISVFMQSYNFLSPCKIKAREFVLRKLCQSLLTFVFAFLYGFAL